MMLKLRVLNDLPKLEGNFPQVADHRKFINKSSLAIVMVCLTSIVHRRAAVRFARRTGLFSRVRMENLAHHSPLAIDFQQMEEVSEGYA